VFDRLEFVYLPSRDAAADVKHFTDGLGAELVFAIEAFATRVAMVRLSPDAPALLLAEHLEGDRPVLVHRVSDLEHAIAELANRGVAVGARFEIPFGPAVELVNPGPQRVALYQGTRLEAAEHLAGRRDF
jgi:urease beta subunit